MVAGICGKLSIPHAILTVEWKEKPKTAIQDRARIARYRLLGRWLGERDLSALVTAHHLDDQAETLLMRLNRGSGARGLAGMRLAAPLPGGKARLLRPLLTWRRSELEEICKSAGLKPVDDPSNADEQFERVRVRRGLAEAGWLDPEGIARSAAHLAAADVALHWAVDKEWETQVSRSGARDRLSARRAGRDPPPSRSPLGRRLRQRGSRQPPERARARPIVRGARRRRQGDASRSALLGRRGMALHPRAQATARVVAPTQTAARRIPAVPARTFSPLTASQCPDCYCANCAYFSSEGVLPLNREANREARWKRKNRPTPG
jgi:tRNA(Ile)-lysidine synthetase-like protein